MSSKTNLVGALLLITSCLTGLAEASDQQIVYIRNTCECWSIELKCVCKIESDPTSVRPLMQRLVNRTAEYYWQDIEFQSMVYDRTTFILANTFADGPFPSGITFKGDFSIVNDSFNHLNMTLNKVELNFETFSGRKPKFSKQYWRYIFDHGEGTLRSLRIIKYQIEDFIIPNYLGAALTQEVRPLTEFKVVGCEVKEVKERAFKNFTQLEVLDLSDNHLTTLPENVFSRNINLQKILLANNQISFLTKTIFDGLPNLLLINLRKNKLTAVPAIPRHTNRRFQPMVYLMADNSIHCRCSLIWVLHELTFHHNLEIEATCSDPTMVRGMPIIEGFTRMDKEACYRIRMANGEESQPEPARLPGATSETAHIQSHLDGKNEAKPSIEQTQSVSDAHGGVQDKLNAIPAPDESGAAQLYKSGGSGQTATNQIADNQNALAALLTHKPTQSQTAAAATPPDTNQVEPHVQTVASETPVSGSGASQSSATQPLIASAPVAVHQQQQQQQLVDVAHQTVLTPSQSALISPVAAAAPELAHEQHMQQSVSNHQADQHSAAQPATGGAAKPQQS